MTEDGNVRPRVGKRVGLWMLVGLLGAWGLRWATLGILRLVLRVTHLSHRPTTGWEPLPELGLLLLGAAVVALAAFAGQRIPQVPAERRGGLSLAAGLVVLVGILHHDRQSRTGMFAWDFVPPPSRDAHPWPPGKTWSRSGEGFDEHVRIGADGWRACEPEDAPQEGRLHVSLVGDSFMFGKGLADDETICWHLREHFAAEDPGAFVFHNHGQPGASARGYARNLDYVASTYDIDVALVGLLVPNDGQVITVNTHREVRDTWWFRVFGSLLTPEDVLEAAIGFVKRGHAPFFDWVSLGQGVDAIVEVAERHDLPVALFVWGRQDPSRNHVLQPFLSEVTRRVAGSERVRVVGIVGTPPPPHADAYHIPGDGHPNRDGTVPLSEALHQPVRILAAEVAP